MFAHLYAFVSPLMSPYLSIDALLECQRYTSGVSKIYQLEKEIAATENNINNSTPVDSSAAAVIDMPLTSYD